MSARDTAGWGMSESADGEHSGWIYNANVFQQGALLPRPRMNTSPLSGFKHCTVNRPLDSPLNETTNPQSPLTSAKPHTLGNPYAPVTTTGSTMTTRKPHGRVSEDPLFLLGSTPSCSHNEAYKATTYVQDHTEEHSPSSYPPVASSETAADDTPSSRDDGFPTVPTTTVADPLTFAVAHACDCACHSDSNSVASHATLSRTAVIIARMVLLLLIPCMGVLIAYKRMSTNIGFCDAGHTTNSALREQMIGISGLQTQQGAVGDAGSAQVKSWGAVQAFFSSLAPDSCTPCPAHSICTRFTVTCEQGFIIAPHQVMSLGLFHAKVQPSVTFSREEGIHFQASVAWLAHYLISSTLDGLPQVGPSAFPPRCVEDAQWAHRMRRVREEAVDVLTRERGRRVCRTGVNVLKDDGVTGSLGEAQRWGLDTRSLESALELRFPAVSPYSFGE